MQSRQAERKACTDLVDCGVRDAGRVCTRQETNTFRVRSIMQCMPWPISRTTRSRSASRDAMFSQQGSQNDHISRTIAWRRCLQRETTDVRCIMGEGRCHHNADAGFSGLRTFSA